MTGKARVAAWVAITFLAGQAQAASPESVIYSFKGGADGALPIGLVAGAAGVLYGETQGDNGFDPGAADIIYELDPPLAGQTAWTKKTLYTFFYGSSGGNDEHRVVPKGPLVRDAAGNLYGTTFSYQLVNQYGWIFRLSPPVAGQTRWTYSILYTFTSDDGYPSGGLIVGNGGALYGNLYSGTAGASLFKLSPPTTAAGAWTKATIYSFGYSSTPYGQLLIDPVGALYGYAMSESFGLFGGVFKLSPPTAGHTQWTEQGLYTFSGGTDGNSPSGNLVIDKAGALYGVTKIGGRAGEGTVFKLAPPSVAHGSWSESVLYSFQASYDGAYPVCGLTSDSEGFLYGVTQDNGGAFFAGTVFRLDPPYGSRTAWQFAVLHQFTGHGVTGRPSEFGGISPLVAVPGTGGRTVLFGVSETGGMRVPGVGGFGVGAIYEVAP